MDEKDFKILFIDDNRELHETMRDFIDKFNKKRFDVKPLENTVLKKIKENMYSRYKIILESAYNLRESLDLIKNNEYDGIIVDINLKQSAESLNDDGIEVIHEVMRKRDTPLVILSARQDLLIDKNLTGKIKVISKDSDPEDLLFSENMYEESIYYLINVNETKLFDISGENGELIKQLNSIFWNNLYSRNEEWIKVKDSMVYNEAKTKEETDLTAIEINSLEEKTKEKLSNVLLRHTIRHLQELKEEEVSEYTSEEAYITPLINPDKYSIGDIFESKENNSKYLLLTPSCTLERIDNEYFLLCEVIDFNEIFKNECNIDSLEELSKTKRREIEKIIKNNKGLYYKMLPKINSPEFQGGVIDFRKIQSLDKDTLLKKYDKKNIKVQKDIIKDIQSSFSSFYGRQGQPDYNFDKLIDRFILDL